MKAEALMRSLIRHVIAIDCDILLAQSMNDNTVKGIFLRTDRLILRYAAFAALATFANLATQRLVLTLIAADFRLVVAVLCGTAVGLILKYVLDKRWIFHDASSGPAMHGKKFSLYTLTGVFTTLVFWGSETAFWLIWRTDIMREFGAILGLTIGYVLKYRLDRRYVFRTLSASEPNLNK